MTEAACIDILIAEHKVILQVVDGLQKLSKVLRTGLPVDIALLRDAVTFMREYADHCHHGKEEDLLFPAFIEHGVPPQGCPIAALLHEHKAGRELVGRLENAIEDYQKSESGAGEAVTAAIDGIVKLYPNHIWKEDVMVFPMAGNVLPVEVREKLHEQFMLVNAGLESGFFERHHGFAERFAEAAQAVLAGPGQRL